MVTVADEDPSLEVIVPEVKVPPILFQPGIGTTPAVPVTSSLVFPRKCTP
jgi:hypothetical protein